MKRFKMKAVKLETKDTAIELNEKDLHLLHVSLELLICELNVNESSDIYIRTKELINCVNHIQKELV